MPAIAHRSQRGGAAPIGLGAVVGLLAACSLVSPATFTPQQSFAGLTAAPTATITPRPAPTIAPSPRPSLEPSPSPSLASGRWEPVTKQLSAPAAWLDFGFASNGNVLAIGTQDAAADPLHLFVARFAPSGRERARHRLHRSVTPLAGDWASIDTTDDSIVIDDYYRPTGLFTLRRFSSSTGYDLSNVYTDGGINRLAVDARGRQFGLPQYGVDGNVYAAVARMDARSRIRLGVDYWLRPLTAGPRPATPGVLGFPTAIAVGLDGRVVLVDEPDVDARYPDGTPRRAAVVTSLAPDLSSPRQWELPVEWPFGSHAFGIWSHQLAIAGAADGSVAIGEPVLDTAGATIAGWRMRLFGPSGDLVGAWGFGATEAGALNLGHPAFGADGRLWAIEVDPATGASTIAVLEPG
jgi:hypothetical protein